MSYNTQENFDNDPNQFGTQGGRRSGVDDPTSGTNFSDSDIGSQAGQQRVGSQGLPQQGFGAGQQQQQQGYGTGTQGQGESWDNDLGDDSRSRSQKDNWTSTTADTTSGGYAGDTTDFNTPGTGGNLTGGQGHQGHHGRKYDTGAGRTGAGATGGNWDDDDFGKQQGRQQGTQGQTGKPSIGERLKGGMEKMAGKVSGDPAMAQKGQERKTGANDDYGAGF